MFNTPVDALPHMFCLFLTWCLSATGFFDFSFGLTFWEPATARCLPSPWSALHQFLYPESCLLVLKKQNTHTVLNYFLSFIIFPLVFMSNAWDTFSFFHRTDRLNRNGLICAFVMKVNFRCLILGERDNDWQEGSMQYAMQIWCWVYFLTHRHDFELQCAFSAKGFEFLFQR